MNVYCVESDKLGILKVFANYESAHYFLRGAVETHPAFCGKVVWLDANLKGTVDHRGAYQATVCDLAWKAQATLSITEQEVLKLI